MIDVGIPADLPIEIRNGELQDYAFILASWSNEAHHIKYDKYISNSIFFPRQKNLINKILKQSLVKVAHLEGERDLICGYAVLQPKFESNTLFIHWAHVKPEYRRQGICTALFNNFLQGANPKLVLTSPCTFLPEFRKNHGIIYDPSVIDNLRGSDE